MAASRRRAVSSSWKWDRSELTTITVSGPPQSWFRAAATSSGLASPTSNGTAANRARSTWRNGSSTSSACSGECGPSVADSRKRVAIQRNGAKRCFKGLHGRSCEPVKRYVVRRPNQDDALNRFDARGQGGKGCGGDLARVEVGGMRDDDRLWAYARHRSRCQGEEPADVRAKLTRIGIIKLPRYGRWAGRKIGCSRRHGIARLRSHA